MTATEIRSETRSEARSETGSETGSETRSTCPYCGVGCGVLIAHEAGRVTGVRGDPLHPANQGRLCTKGVTLHLSTGAQGRLLEPLQRRADARPKHGATAAAAFDPADWQPIDWDAAVAQAAARFADTIREHGPDSVAFYLSGQLLTEDYYVFNRLAKGLIGTANVDTNSRLCMSSAVAAYKQTLGADAPPCAYEDFDATDCLLVAGSNLAYAHPVAYRRIEAARAANPALKLIVVDPRRTDTAANADLHLPILPGTDIWLFNAMLNVLVWDGLVDSAFVARHTSGFDALKAHVHEVTPAAAAAVCGVPAADIVTAARWWGRAAAPMSIWCQGLNQSRHGTHNGTALIALSLATGKIGRPGCGPFSMTGQPNAMGGREVGGLANQLAAHRELDDPADRAEIAALWGVERVPDRPGLTAVELFDAIGSGRVKAVWIVCTNPAHSLPDQRHVREALAACPYVVVQEAFRSTETTAFADLLLPATTWAEKQGTVTNSERRISFVRAAIAAPGQARADWRIATDFARALAPAIGQAGQCGRFAWASAAEVFDEHAMLTGGRDLDITGLSHAVLEALGPQQWPFPAGATRGRVRLYEDARFATADRRARFVVPVATQTAEAADARFPLRLTTGRLRDQWHGMSRTGRVAQLGNHVDEPRIELHAADMAGRGLQDGDLARVASRRGEIVLRAFASAAVRQGQAFVAMHWSSLALASAGANELTARVVDPFSRQPELKHAAVQVEAIVLAHQLVLMRTEADPATAQARGLARLEAAGRLLSRFRYASIGLAGREHPVVVMRIAHDAPLPAATIAALDATFGLDGADCLSYRDARRGIEKQALIDGDALLGVRLAGETAAAAWLRDAIVERRPTGELRRWLLAPRAAPPADSTGDALAGGPGRGTVICNCLDVPLSRIVAAVAAGADLAGLQATLGCGTSCGSCLPELRRLVAAPAAAAGPAAAQTVP